MENFDQQILEALLELCVEHFQPILQELLSKESNELDSKVVAQFLLDFLEFSNTRLIKINPVLEDNLTLLQDLFIGTISSQPEPKNFKFISILHESLTDEILRRNILYLNKIPENEEAKKLRDEYIETHLFRTSFQALNLLTYSLIIKYKNEDGTVNEEEFVKEFVTSSIAKLKEIYSFADEEFIRVGIVNAIVQFEEQILLEFPLQIAKALHKAFWQEIKTPFELNSFISIHRKQIDGKLIQREILENILEAFQKRLSGYLKSKKGKDEKLIKDLISAIDAEVRKIPVFEYQAKFVIFNISLSIIEPVYEKKNLEDISQYLTDLIEIDFHDTINKVVELIDKLFKSRTENLFDEYSTIDFENGYPKILVDFILEFYDKNLFLIECDEEIQQAIIRSIFNYYYSKFYKQIPIQRNNQIIICVAQLLNCHESQILPQDTINGLEIAEFISSKLKKSTENIYQEYSVLRNRNMIIASRHDIHNLPEIIHDFENFWLNFTENLSNESKKMKVVIDEELNLWGIEGDIRELFFSYIRNSLRNQLFDNEIYELIQFFNQILEVDIMKSEDINLKEIKENLLSIKEKAIKYENLEKELKEFGIHFDNESEMQRILKNKQDIINKNFFNDFNLLKADYIRYQIPFLPFLLKHRASVRLSPSEYLLFSIILKANLNGQLFKWQPKNLIKEIDISERSAFNLIDTLEKKYQLVIRIEDNNEVNYMVNAPVVLNLAKEYYKNKLR
ncbi:MAG: hypothetical protein NT007_01135 [Candidatus Kapabacteria bacterium]|nr:hypothetical protein [Candidatus Kapabacteria bacterium]